MRLLKWLFGGKKPTLNKPTVSGSLSFGEMDKDRFCTVLKDGEETNCRMYMWDAEDVKRLQAIGDEIHRQNGLY